MSTIEQVAQELKNLNGVADLSTELLVDGFSGLNSGNDLVVAELKGIREVLNNFMNHVPESIVNGFEKIIVTDRTERENFVVNREKISERDSDPANPGKDGKDGNTKGTFGKAFKSGREEDLGDMFGFKGLQQSIGSKLGNIAQIADKTGLTKALQFLGTGLTSMFGAVYASIMTVATKMIGFIQGGGIMKVIGKIGTGLKALQVGMLALMSGVQSAIMAVVTGLGPALVALAPFIAIGAAIAAGLAALTMGVMGFIEDFKGQEGGMFDKILAGLLGFFDGFTKILTIPLDWIINLTAKVLDFFGLDGAAKVLEEFSLTAMVDELTDGILDFLLKIKDGIVGFASNAWNGIKSFFGFEDEPEELKTLSGSERKVLEDVRDAREDGIKRMTDQGFTQEEAEARAEKGSFDPIKTRKESRKLSTEQINDRLNEDMAAQVIAQSKTPEGASSVKEKQYRYDITDPVTGELIDSAGTPEEAAKIAMETGGKMENPVERTSTDEETQQRLAASVDQSLFEPTRADGTAVLASDGRVQQGTINGTAALRSIQRAPTAGRIDGTAVLSGRSPSVIGGTKQNVELSERMTVENNQMQSNQATANTSTSAGATILTQSDNSTTIQNTNVNAAPMPSAVDKSDRTSVRRGRRI